MTVTPQLIQDKIREITSPGQAFEIAEREVGGQRLRLYRHAPATLIDVLQAARGHAAFARPAAIGGNHAGAQIRGTGAGFG